MTDPPKMYPIPVYVAPFQGGYRHQKATTPHPNISYVWGYPAAPPTMAMPPRVDGTNGWPIYIQGGTPSNPQFAYYPVPPGAVPPSAAGPQKHRRRRSEPLMDDDERCDCPECTQPKQTGRDTPGPAPPAPPPPPGPHAPPTTLIPTQVFAPNPTIAQQTTFIPYVVPMGASPPCHHHRCNSTKSTTGSSNCGDRRHSKPSSTSSSTYHYAPSCECPSCKARRMAIEMDRINEDRRREQECKEAMEFMSLTERVNREDREAEMAEYYRAAKRAAGADGSQPMYNCIPTLLEQEHPWAIPVTGFQTGRSTPILLEPACQGGYPAAWTGHLTEENHRLRRDKADLKHQVRDLTKDVRVLKKDLDSTRKRSRSQTPAIEVQIPGLAEKHGPPRSAFASPRKTTPSKRKQGHICYNSDCVDFDSCSECEFECNKKGCRTCRPHGGRH
ncbi:hypothetical protein TWF694_009333 [Orbilia ellipsospora]|uniref:Uncharacterized protein n=1 Tax=Orbilia ellipsospora TaxID=2528407 RepID=A0AAV9XEN1_9PEZI